MVTLMAVFRLDQSGKIISGVVGHRKGKSRAGRYKIRTPWAELFTDSRRGRELGMMVWFHP